VRDLVAERQAHALVGVDREDPVVAGQAGRVVLLVRITAPGPHFDARRVLASDGQGLVGAPGVDDDPLVGPGD
jgi:hypothetical protein